MFILANQLSVDGVLPQVHEMFSVASRMLRLGTRILQFGCRRSESWRRIGVASVLSRMNTVSRPNSAENKSYDAKREVGETVLPKVPMQGGPLSRDANFGDLEQLRLEQKLHCQT